MYCRYYELFLIIVLWGFVVFLRTFLRKKQTCDEHVNGWGILSRLVLKHKNASRSLNCDISTDSRWNNQKKSITNVDEAYVQDRGRSSQTCGAPRRTPGPCTGWGRYGSRRWVEDSVSSPSSAGSLHLLFLCPAAPLSGSDLTVTCCPSACGPKDRREVVGRQVRWARELLSKTYWPWDHQLLTIMDAVRAAVIIRKAAVDLSLDVVKLQLGGALWRRRLHFTALSILTFKLFYIYTGVGLIL